MNTMILLLPLLLVDAPQPETKIQTGWQEYEELEMVDANGEWKGHGCHESHWGVVELRQSSPESPVDWWVFIGCFYKVRQYWDYYDDNGCGEYAENDTTVYVCCPAHGEKFTVEWEEDAVEHMIELYRKWKDDK